MTKLRIDQLPRHLQQELSPVYLVSGDETLLVEESCDSIRQQAIKEGFSERERYFVDKQFDWSQLLTASNSMSLFGDKKIIELRIETGKPGDKGSKVICEYLTNLSDDNRLLIVTPKLDSGSQRSKWVKAIEKAGQWLPVWPVSSAQLPRWLGQRIKQAGLTADSHCIDLLAARTEGNLLAAHQEIEKLKLLSIDGYLTPELISGAVADSARYDVFGLIDKTLYGDARGAVKNLQGLKTEGTDATVVLWGLAREIRTLLNMTIGLQQGQSFSWVAKQSGVWDKRQPIVQQAIKRLPTKQLEILLRQANAIDKSIKGLRKAEPWDELLDLVLNFAGAKSLNTQNLRLSIQA
ncbi:MAG: DNA polymerase III subunit delta [Cellvibrionaceae bacterium]